MSESIEMTVTKKEMCLALDKEIEIELRNSVVGMLVGGLQAGVLSEELQYGVVQNINSMASIAVIFHNEYQQGITELNGNIPEPDLSIYKLFMSVLHGILHGLRRKDLKVPKYYENLELRTEVLHIIMPSDKDGKEGKALDPLEIAFSHAWQTFMTSASFIKGLKIIEEPVSKGIYGLMAGAYYGLDHFNDEYVSSVASDELNHLITDYLGC